MVKVCQPSAPRRYQQSPKLGEVSKVQLAFVAPGGPHETIRVACPPRRLEFTMTIREDVVCLEDQVHEALELSPYMTRSRGVRCEAENGRVTIRGEVRTFFQKQMATEALRKLRGVDKIDNQLEVTWAAID